NSSDTHIGSTDPGAGNLISGNIQQGISGWASVLANKIGTNTAGDAAIPNGGGGGLGANFIGDGSAPGRNLISRHIGNGIENAYLVSGNFIGTDINGTVPLPNTGDGVVNAGDIRNNLIAGNTGYGVRMTDVTFRGDFSDLLTINANTIGRQGAGNVKG